MAFTNKFLWLDLFSKKNTAEVTVLSTLKSNVLFAKLTPKEIKYVSEVVHVRNYVPGEIIFSQYEKGLGMYMIAKGAVEIRVKGEDQNGGAENEILVTTLAAGSFFGELALIDTENKRTASSYAQGPTTLVGFFKPDLLEIMERKPATGVKILFQLSRVLGRRLSETTDLISTLRREIRHKDKEAA